ncbi:hypothetical protein ACFQFC_41070, partial [Amorphoplanes digitatis]|uniref:hypothetical protein n=1 Tax=Actinoplanes digitatis TaxID=1868 RepID=UPI00361CEA0F
MSTAMPRTCSLAECGGDGTHLVAVAAQARHGFGFEDALGQRASIASSGLTSMRTRWLPHGETVGEADRLADLPHPVRRVA